MNWNFNDFNIAKPKAPGNYEWWSKAAGMINPVKWDGKAWRFINGDKIPFNVVRWWR